MNAISGMPTGIESSILRQHTSEWEGKAVKHVPVFEQHVRLYHANLMDQSDDQNELASTKSYLLHPSQKEILLSGNAFALENTLRGNGRIFLKKCPLPHARPHKSPADFFVRPGKNGFDAFLLGSPDKPDSDNWVELEYEGGTFGRMKALQDWQQSSRPSHHHHKIPLFLSNTWGDRARDSRIREDFIEKEIAAAKRLGVDILQIDDGWQRGTTMNSAKSKELGGIWEGYWNRDPNFWSPHAERLPNGLLPIAEKVKNAGLRLGLWFSPDSWNHFANWQKDAQCLLDYYRTLGISFFKIDGVQALSEKALQNLHSFFSMVLKESKGAVVFDLDITAQFRPGYFGELSVGPLFVENRYTDWRNYWPHTTLRNLWNLSHWVDPRRLRMEFLNQKRHMDQYEHDPLAPNRYAPDCLFATVMFSNPLGWFEVSNLPQSYFKTIPPLVDTWKKHRDKIFHGTIVPIGNEPDGVGFSGFASVSAKEKSGYLLLFRGAGQIKSDCFSVPGITGKGLRFTRLAGKGKLSLRDGTVGAELEKLGYLFARFERD